MKLKLPAEEQDHLMRPAYVTTSRFGTSVCENRYVRYLPGFNGVIHLACGTTSTIRRSGDGMRTLALGRCSYCCESNEADSRPDRQIRSLIFLFADIVAARLPSRSMGPDHVDGLKCLGLLGS
jgi:hypothetical protein